MQQSARRRGGWVARVAAAAVASACCGAALVSACGQGSDELPPLDRHIPNPVEAGADADAAPDAPELGVIADPEAPCDDGLALDEADPMNAARAVEICQKASITSWGIVSAKWTQLDGSDPPTDAVQLAAYHLGHGIVPELGAVERQAGARMLAISSGAARQLGDPDFVDPALGLDKKYSCTYPDGYPKPSPACSGTVIDTELPPFDAIALEVKLTAPTEAKGFAFRFDFHTAEWPDWVCSEFNDAFFALLSPAPQAHPDGNISFDSKGNPVSVNAAFVRACSCPDPPCITSSGKKFACDLGGEPLVGTGFEGHAATGWLKTQALVEGGETITLRWTVYDAGDGILDSTTLIDDFTWLGALDGGVITEPEETPK